MLYYLLQIVEKGSYEYNLYKSVPEDGISQSDLMKSIPNAKIEFSKAILNKWIEMKRVDNVSMVFPLSDSVKDVTAVTLSQIREGNDENIQVIFLEELKRQKLVQESTYQSYVVRKGKNFTLNPEKVETGIKAQMIQDGSWKNKTFNEYRNLFFEENLCVHEEHYINNPTHVVVLLKAFVSLFAVLPDADQGLVQCLFGKKRKSFIACCATDDILKGLHRTDYDSGTLAIVYVIFASIYSFQAFVDSFDITESIDVFNGIVLLKCCLLLNPEANTGAIKKEIKLLVESNLTKKRKVILAFIRKLRMQNMSNLWIYFIADCFCQMGIKKRSGLRILHRLERNGKFSNISRSKDKSNFLQLKSWYLKNEIADLEKRFYSDELIEREGLVYRKIRDPPGQRSVYIPPGETNRESYRVFTFLKYPTRAPVRTSTLASAGFYYTGYKDRVKCFCCGMSVESWTAADDPASYRWHTVDCELILGKNHGNVPLASARYKNFQRMENQKITMQNHVSLLQTLNLSVEADRIKSFISWSAKTIQPSELARCGFFYLGHSDRVQCFSCSKVFSHWNYGNKVAEEHKKHSSACRMVREVEEKNIPIPEDQRESVPYVVPLTEPPDVSEDEQEYLRNLYPLHTQKHPDMKNVDRRFATFDIRWPNTEGCPSPRKISDAGFFYIGPDQRVQCWYCGGIMECWDPGDEAWTEHAKYFPSCNFVLQRKGLDFVNHILSLFPNMDLPGLASPSGVEADESEQLPASYVPSTSSSTSNVEIEESMEQRLLRAMSANEVMDAIKLGLEQTKVERVVRKKLEKNSTYSSVEAIFDDVMALPSDDLGADANELEAGVSTETKRVKILEAKVKQHEETKRCKVCLDKPSGMVFIPCGHLCTCIECAANLEQCPVCRSKIEKSVVTYLS